MLKKNSKINGVVDLSAKYFYIHKFEETIKYSLLVQIILDANLGYMLCQNTLNIYYSIDDP